MNLIEADRLAKTILAQYNVQNTVIEWDNSRSRAGVCKFIKNSSTGIIRKRVIFSRVVFKAISEDEQRDTILHEIAHARLPHTAGHGPEWKAIHRAMGGNAQPTLKSTAVVAVVSKWAGACKTTRTVVARRNRLTDQTRARLVCTCHRERLIWVPNA